MHFFFSNLQIVTSNGSGELWHGQAQNRVNFDFGVQFDLEGHDQSSHKTIGILTKVFYISGPNLVILAERGDELSRGQARDWRTDGHTHTHTDAGDDNTPRPKLPSGKNANTFLCLLKKFSTSNVIKAFRERLQATCFWPKVTIYMYYGTMLEPCQYRSLWTHVCQNGTMVK